MKISAVEEFSSTRRFSPRLRDVLRPYYGSSCKGTKDCHADKANEALRIDASKITPGPNMGSNKSRELSQSRRCSPRLRDIPETKKPRYGPNSKESQHHTVDKINQEFSTNAVKQDSLLEAGEDNKEEKLLETHVEHCKGNGLLNRFGNEEVQSINTKIDMDEKHWVDNINFADGKSARAKVKETLRIYNKYYLHFFQEIKNEKSDIVKADKSLKRKKTCVDDKDAKRSFRPRLDLMAFSKVKKSNEVLYPEKRFGHLPGIDIGYQFYSRAEMAAIGFHSHWLGGIDVMGKCYKKVEPFKNYNFPLAVAIVLSGQYEDDKDDSEEVIYTGQGGNDLLGKKHQVKDQELVRGNLALKNNMEQSLPVRVVRGHAIDRKAVKVYTYDGLYKVVDYWNSKGVSGFVVCKYRLKRLQGQPRLTTNQVHFNERASQVSKISKLVCSDISESQEEICIPAINSVDDAPVVPKGFVYTKSNHVAENVILPPNAVGCKCKGDCTNPRTCACARLNGSDFPYVDKDGGRLIEAKDVVVECGPNCGCGPSCINRISQQGIKYHLEIFRTENKGWAVKTKDFIPSGAPVCEYIGVLRKTNELDAASGNDYIFEIDCLQTMKEIGGRERRLGDVSASASTLFEKMDKETLESVAPEFCIDAGSVGNIARFINHSCEPNLFVQCVLSKHHDLRLARVVLFAADNIAPLQELTYDYGYALDSVVDSNGNIREQPCHCGTADCRKRLY